MARQSYSQLIIALVILVALWVGYELFAGPPQERTDDEGIEVNEASDFYTLEDNGHTYELDMLPTIETISIDGNVAVMRTNAGDITFELFADKSPQTVQNFIKLANEGFYNGTRFHRVIPGFMIQGGDPNSRDDNARSSWGTGGPGYQFADEINDVPLTAGVLAMANAGPNTNGSQFFIVTADATPWLDGKHTAFGRVTNGMDVVMTIEAVPTNAGDQPVLE